VHRHTTLPIVHALPAPVSCPPPVLLLSSSCLSLSAMACKRSRAVYLECTACSNGNYAEHLHPLLHVPLCGPCKLSYTYRDLTLDDKNESSCVWCGLGDGCELFMCDSCIHSYCTDCISRNFGLEETKIVREKSTWTCYTCSTSSKLAEVQVEGSELSFYSLEKVFAQIRPPDREPLDTLLIQKLSPSELRFAALFCREIGSSVFYEVDVCSYLRAEDIHGSLFRLSSALRQLFLSQPIFNPGLFQTPYGKEHGCRLYDHQIVSLNAMLRIEGADETFGALRGG
jgi:hypothetical protein